LIDPLDGTKEFLKKNDEFTVNIALVHSSRVIAGIVYAPALGELYCAAKDVGVFKCEIKNHQITTTYKIASHTIDDLKEPIRVVASRSHPSQELVSWLDNLKLSYELKMFGSSLKFCRLVDGSADVYPRFGLTSQWDTAAAQCIVELAGGAVLDMNGQSLTYGVHKDILNPSFIAMRATSMRALI
jgi:3'(2'), 5'-bisphosphate nucleotidase